MSYWANGNGQFKVDSTVDVEKLNALLETIDPDEYFNEFEYDSNCKRLFVDYHEDYNEEAVVEVVKKLADFGGLKGYLEFEGEEGDRWRFVIKDGKAYSCDGYIVYDEPCADNEIKG